MKQKKPIYKRPWFWVIIVVLVLGLGGLGSQDDKAQDEAAAVTRAVPADSSEEKGLPDEKPAPEPAPEPQPEPAPEPEPVKAAPAAAPEPVAQSYVLNTNTMKFHVPICSSVGDIKAANRQDFTGTREEVIAKGYSPCGRCHP